MNRERLILTKINNGLLTWQAYSKLHTPGTGSRNGGCGLQGRLDHAGPAIRRCTAHNKRTESGSLFCYDCATKYVAGKYTFASRLLHGRDGSCQQSTSSRGTRGTRPTHGRYYLDITRHAVHHRVRS